MNTLLLFAAFFLGVFFGAFISYVVIIDEKSAVYREGFLAGLDHGPDNGPRA